MTLNEIKSAVKSGKTVCVENDDYIVEYDGEELVARHVPTSKTSPILWMDGRTLVLSEDKFYIKNNYPIRESELEDYSVLIVAEDVFAIDGREYEYSAMVRLEDSQTVGETFVEIDNVSCENDDIEEVTEALNMAIRESIWISAGIDMQKVRDILSKKRRRNEKSDT